MKCSMLGEKLCDWCNATTNVFISSLVVYCRSTQFLQPFNSKRDRLQILADILNLCRKPQVKTRVMYKTNVSYRLLQDCLLQLQKKRLLEAHHSMEKYSTTEKGLEFLHKWTELQQFMITKKPLQGSEKEVRTTYPITITPTILKPFSKPSDKKSPRLISTFFKFHDEFQAERSQAEPENQTPEIH
jgi:predicted transcriptional regulator